MLTPSSQTTFTRDALQQIIDVIPDPVFVKNSGHILVMVNKAFCEFVGRPHDFIVGKSDFDLVSPDQAREYWRVDDEMFETGANIDNEETLTRANGDTRIIFTRKRLLTLDAGNRFIVAIISDMTDLREAEAKNRHLAFHDHLTGLANRALLAERIEQTLVRVCRGAETCALLLLDLDGFKQVNDTYGHQAGDQLLKLFSERLSANLQPTDTVARLGGDEFAVLLHNTDENAVGAICERILNATRQPFELAGVKALVGTSIGVSFATSETDQVNLLRMADIALYKAKSSGRLCFRIFTDEMDELITSRTTMEYELREALKSGNELVVVYQPILSNSSEEVIEVEALVRWNHPRLGMVMPLQFISIAEEAGLADTLCDWVLDQACTAWNQWPNLSFSINLSPVQLHKADITTRLLGIVRRNGVPPDRIVLEITESAILKPSATALANIQELRQSGFRIALDDFGTGYSSLSHLQSLKVDRIKIDRSFVQDVGQSGDAEAIVLALCKLGAALGLSVTAEGVETDTQRKFLRTTECSEVQGYFFSRPIAAEFVPAFMDRAASKGTCEPKRRARSVARFSVHSKL